MCDNEYNYYMGCSTIFDDNDDDLLTQQFENCVIEWGSSDTIKSNQICIVFDIDDTLLHVADDLQSYTIRNHAIEILHKIYCDLDCAIMLWSAGIKQHVERTLVLLDPEKKHICGAIHRIDNCLTCWYCRPLNQFGKVLSRGMKDLKTFETYLDKIYNVTYSNMLLVDNSPIALKSNSTCHRGILIDSFIENQDSKLLDLYNKLEKMCEFLKRGGKLTNYMNYNFHRNISGLFTLDNYYF